MCMIAYRPVEKGRGSNIPNAVIDTAFGRHPDGYGLAYRDADGLHIEKFAPADKAGFRKSLKRVDKARLEYVAHWRFATHGKPCEELAHPFTYKDKREGEVAVFHNGVINIAVAADGSESDSSVFVRDVLAKLPSAWWRVPALRYLVGQSIGWSRLVVMTATETVNLQESEGDWDGGIWYSSNHKPAVPFTPKKWVPGTVYGKQAPVAAPTAISTWQQKQAVTVVTPVSTSSALLPTDDKAWTTRGLRHAGHPLTALVPMNFDADGDYPSGVMCNTCDTTGDLYIIDGTYYVDMAHKSGTGALWDDDSEEEVYFAGLRAD
jgi:hypothetical protein